MDVENFPFEGIGFNRTALKGMSRQEFDANVAHHFSEDPRKIEELFNLINDVNDKKSSGKVPKGKNA